MMMMMMLLHYLMLNIVKGTHRGNQEFAWMLWLKRFANLDINNLHMEAKGKVKRQGSVKANIVYIFCCKNL